MLTSLRAEREVAKTAFRAAVAASIRLEAELLLVLEEYRNIGGFAPIQERARELAKEERAHQRYMSSPLPSEPAHLRPFDDNDKRIHDIFLPDVLDLNKAFNTVGTLIKCVGDPTMATERAALRLRIIGAVKQEFLDAINAELDEQEARDKALLEARVG